MTMKLYYNPGACSLSPHIILCETGLPHQIEKVDLKSKTTESGKDFKAIAERGQVPLLVLDSGETLTEGAAIVQYLADLKPQANLAPANGTMDRVRLQEWLNYISTEVHKAHAPLFYGAAVGEKAQEFARGKISQAYDYLSGKLSGQDYLMGKNFTVADAYLFTVLNWHQFVNIDLSAWPVLKAYHARVASRPSVQQAMKAEGLTPSAQAA